MDGVEQEFQGQLTVLRVNVQDPAGRELGQMYDFRYTPTFIFFDAQGNERWRSIGSLDVDQIQSSLP